MRNYPNWLIQWTSQFANTEVPQNYAVWTGIWTIAAALGGKVYLPYGHDRTYPNMYIFLVGPPRSGKSHSAMLAIKGLRELSQNNPSITIHRGEITKSFLISLLQGISLRNLSTPNINQIPSLGIFSDELANTVDSGPAGAVFLRGMTQLYNSEVESGTHLHQMRSAERSAVSWLALATPRWLKLSIPTDMVDSGFVARIITILEPLSDKIIPPSEMNQFDVIRLQKLIADLEQIAQLNGQFTLTKEATDYYDTLHEQTRKRRLSIKDQITRDMHGSEDEYTTKVAMCLAVSQSDDLVITSGLLRNAASLVISARDTSVELYRSLAVGNSQIAFKYIILEKMREVNRAIGHTELRRKVGDIIPNSRLFNEAITSLIEEELIGAVRIPKLGRGVYYILKEDK